ncbi:MAG: hypothetical protein CUN55_05800 [Phototrophicales bacterium]|nr:MAG: hypothetical protein CUN55_05800 [Phototrophicales bacterium]
MSGIPRILVVDANNHLGHVVRASMFLLDRQYVLVEIPTAKEALSEVIDTAINLAVVTYDLDGSMNGLEWATRAIRQRAGARIIVVADDHDPKPDAMLLESQNFQYIPYSSGEQFLRALRIGLDGPEVVAAEEASKESAAAPLDLGPVPKINIDRSRAILLGAIREIGALGIGVLGGLIADRAGRIIVDEGATSQIDKEQVTPLLGPSFAQAIRMSPHLGGNSWLMKFYEGDDYQLFALSAGYHYFMMLLVTPSRGALGAVMRYGRQAARDLSELLGNEAWEYKEAQATATQTMIAAPIAEPEPEPIPTPEEITSKLMAPTLEPVGDLDIDALFATAEQVEDFDLFDAEDSSGISDLLDDGTISFEEARNMGLLGD